MVFKLIEGAQKTWRRLDGQNLLPKLIANVKFKNGIEASPPGFVTFVDFACQGRSALSPPVYISMP
jgi:hypothetical protein